jgi:hypothetical protein
MEGTFPHHPERRREILLERRGAAEEEISRQAPAQLLGALPK